MKTKKIIFLVTILLISLGNFSFSSALSLKKIEQKETEKKEEKEKKLNKEIKKFQNILDKYFIKKDDNLGNYRDFGGYISNAKYNKIVEKQLKLIIIKTYDSNKEFYEKFSYFNQFSGKNFEYYEQKGKSDLDKLLINIPKANGIQNISEILFNEYSVSDKLLESSFKVNYNSKKNYDSFLNSLDRVIKNFKNRNGYYPSLEELKKEEIYLNQEKKEIGDKLDDVIYEVKYLGKGNKHDILIKEFFSNKERDFTGNIKKTYGDRYSVELEAYDVYELLNQYDNRLSKNMNEEIQKDILNTVGKITESEKKIEVTEMEQFKNLYLKNSKELSLSEKKEMIKKYKDRYKKNYNKIFGDIVKYLEKKYFSKSTYTLKYKDKFYTLEEAKAEIKKIENLKIEKKDYEKLIGNAELEKIPEIYKKIPSDSIFIHIKNPQFLFSFLDDKKNNSNSGLQIIKKLRDLIVEKMGTSNWEEIKKNFKNEFIIVLSDLDLVSPNFLIILDKKDKGILVPGEKAMVAKSVGDKIYISLSKELLEKYSNLDEKNSIYNSSDFRYVWFKKQKLKKDIFFFAGDNFFEKITSLEYFLNMKRKINDYIYLDDLQDYIFALQKISSEKIQNFEKLKKIIKFEGDNLENFEVKNSIVTSKSIGKIGDIKNISEINYNLEKISREELSIYKENILDYRELWQASLDPLGVIFSEKKDGYKIDFFMTPIPSLKDFEMEFLVQIFSNFGKKDFEIIKNPKMRIGIFGIVFGFDSDKLKKFIDEKMQEFNKDKDNFKDDKNNRNLLEFLNGYFDINRELFGGGRDEKNTKESILDYLDGEFLISFGGIDTSIFDSWNAEKLDIILAVKFKNKIKAKEFLSIIRKKMSQEFSRNSRNSIEGKAKKLLAKPLGEEYKNITIYSVPAPFIGNIYYSIIDSFAYISISKKSLQKSIDFYEKPDSTKDKFIKNYLSGDKIFYSFFDSEKLEKSIKKILSEKDLTDLFVAIKREGLFSEIGDFNPLMFAINKYYNNYEYSKITGKKIKEISGKIGFLSFSSLDGEIFLSIDKNILKITNIEINSEVKNVFGKIDDKFFLEKGGNIIELLKDSEILEELFRINIFNSILNKDFRREIIPNNLAFSLGIGNDEIQLKMASFTEVEGEKGITSKVKNIFSETKNTLEKPNNILYIIIGILLFIIILIIGFTFFRKNLKK